MTASNKDNSKFLENEVTDNSSSIHAPSGIRSSISPPVEAAAYHAADDIGVSDKIKFSTLTKLQYLILDAVISGVHQSKQIQTYIRKEFKENFPLGSIRNVLRKLLRAGFLFNAFTRAKERNYFATPLGVHAHTRATLEERRALEKISNQTSLAKEDLTR